MQYQTGHLALFVERSFVIHAGDSVVVIETNIVFAGPHNFHGSFGDFSDGHGFADEIAGGIGAAPESSAEQRGVKRHLLGFQAGDFRGSHAIHGFKLRPGPNFTAVIAKVDDGVERFHHGVREVRYFIFGGNFFGGARQSRGGVAHFAGDDAGSSRRFRILLAQSGGGQIFAGSIIPGDVQLFTSEFRGPKTRGDHGNAGRNLYNIEDTRDSAGFLGVEADDFAAKHRRSRHHRSEHPGNIDVQTELRGAIGFRGRVEAVDGFADQSKIFRIFQRDVGRRRLF